MRRIICCSGTAQEVCHLSFTGQYHYPFCVWQTRQFFQQLWSSRAIVMPNVLDKIPAKMLPATGCHVSSGLTIIQQYTFYYPVNTAPGGSVKKDHRVGLFEADIHRTPVIPINDPVLRACKLLHDLCPFVFGCFHPIGLPVVLIQVDHWNAGLFV